MTLAEYIRSLPAARVERAANDLGEAARIEAEHAALPGAIFDTPEAAEGGDSGGISGEVRPELSFDLSDDDSVRGFISGMEVSHPELVNRLRRDERAWDEMVALDRGHMTRLQRDGGVKFSGDDNADYDFYRWAYGRGMLASDTSLGGLASAFGRGFLQIVKGAAKLTGTAAKSVVNPTAGVELAATAVDAAQAAVAEYQQLGAGLAALTSGDDPQVRMAAMYELAKFSDEEQRTHNAWRKAISDSFAEVPVDEDSVEFLSETFDVSNLIGAGAGKLVTRGLKRVGASGAAELLGRSRTAFGSEMLASTLSKVPLVGTPYKRAILVGQADLLSTEAQVAYEAVARAQADLAAKRATLAASPASDPKDVLLRKVAEAETDVARRLGEFNSAKSKLDSVRRNVAETLDLEGRGLLNLAAAGAVEGTGTLVRGTGRTMTRAYRGLSELLTGEADNAAFDMAAGQVAGGLANKGNIITRLGQDIVTAGRTMAQNGATIPYFRRLRQAEDATKLTRGAAAFIDWSHLGWAADKLGDTVKAGAAGAPVSGAFGYVASGGDLAAAVESAGAGAAYGIGGGAYGQWEAYKDPRFRYEELLSNRREFRDTLSAREVGGASQLQIFDQLDAGDQLAIASYAQGKPDVAFRFINDRNQASGYYDRDNNVVVINRASKTPLADIFRHEVAHFIERHGLQAPVRELYLGDAEKGVIGQFTALDPLGNPVFVESTDPDGTTRYRYRLNDAGEKLKAEYTAKIRAVDPTFSMSDEYLASELFAEQYADYLFGGGFRRDLSRNAFDNVVEALAGKPVVKNFLGGIGLLFDSDDNVVGTGVFRELKGNEGVRRLISGFTADVAKGRTPAIEDSVEQHVFTETELRDPELATKWLQGGGAMRFGPDGRPVYDAKGVPQFLTEKEADAQQRDLANELIAAIEKHVAENPADADVLQRREIIDVNGVKRTLFSGRRIPAAVIESLEAQKRFNPHQLAHLRAASASVEKHGTGAMIAHFYQAASRKLGGKAYKTVGGRWRRDGVVGFQITKDGNVVINSVSWEQLAENATKAAKTKLAREVYATAGMPVDTAIMADVKTYLGNLVDGKPGATDIGEARRDFINNLLGIRMAANAEANPLFETTTAPKTILTNLRLDRINRMAPLDYVDVAWGPQQYRQAKANMRPETAVQREVGANADFSTPPTDDEARSALASDKQPKFGLARDLEPGTPVGLRIDIPAFQRTGKYVVSVHEKAKGSTVGRIVGYDTVVTVDNPTFMSNEAGAAKILTGDKNKFPIATVEGSFNSSREIPADINEWTAVGFDPLDHSYFYDKRTDEPVVGGKQAVSVGNSVFVKDPVYSNRSDFQYRPEELSSSTLDKDEAILTANGRRTRAISESRFYVPSDGRGRAFHDAIARTAKEHPKGAAVEVKDVGFYTDPENLLFLSPDGLAGAAIKSDGDLVSVFKHPTSTAKSSEILSEAAPLALKLDAYDMAGFLPTLYSKFGFRPVAQVAFDPAMAPAGWNYDLLGQPPVVLMVRDPLNKAGLPDATIYNDAIRAKVPTVSYDEAMKLQQAALDRIGPVQYRPEDSSESAPKRPRLPGAGRAPIENERASYQNIEIGKSAESLPKVALENDSAAVFARIDAAKAKITDDPLRLADERGYVEYFKDAGVWGDVLTAPPMLRLILERPQEYVDLISGGYHGRLTKLGTMEAADAGLDATVEMRAAIKGRPPEMIAAMHHLWGILSRMLPPVEQEAAWLRLVSRPEILQEIQNSIDGSFSLTHDQWKAKVSAAMAASNEVAKGRGNQGTANANAFYLMLANWNGIWNQVSDVYTAENSTESGRRFWSLGAGSTGIANKVQRFIGLTFGIPGLIMDRWKFVEMYFTQFGKAPQDYFRYSAFGTPEDPNGIYGVYGPIEGKNPNFSLAFYEGLEAVLGKAIANSPELRAALGRHANLGGLHWKGWNAIKNEAVGHSSLDLTYDLALLGRNPSVDDVVNQIAKKEYYTEGLVGNRIVRFALPAP